MRTRRLTHRGLAIALLLCFAAAVLLASLLAGMHCGHHHLFDDQCSTCAQLQSLRSFVKSLGLLLWVGAMLTATPMFIGAATFAMRGKPTGNPVFDKVRLNN